MDLNTRIFQNITYQEKECSLYSEGNNENIEHNIVNKRNITGAKQCTI